MAVSQLQQVIERSDLPESDKDIWLHALEIIDDDEAQVFLDAIAEDPSELDTITRNLKLKKIALATNDTALMGQIIEEELEEVSDTSHE